MKVIIAGVTGYIGQEILSQCLANPYITSIIALSRRELGITDGKLRVYLMREEDYLSYSDPALYDELKDAEACIWTLGLRPSQASNNEYSRRVSVDYVAAAAPAFQRVSNLSSTSPRNKFRFVYVSGAGVERDQGKRLFFLGNFRRLRGEVENVLLRHAEGNSDAFEPYILRPGLVPSTAGTLKDRLWSLAPSVKLDILVKAVIGITLNGYKQNTITNQMLVDWEN
ncbi:hypothetical protein BJX63DRAFT_434367 [Aspergillus granulosus]|uniref:NAD(P)-binding domain-containing protein n=1 Tax=Aspergillus granulosus TaxID=176169 RepID=A0ABR4H4F3_9EURO